MKPSLEQLKEMRDTVAKWTPTLGTPDCAFEAALFPVWLARLDAHIAAEEAREKEWPQEGDTVWRITTVGPQMEQWNSEDYSHEAKNAWAAIGMVQRTRAEAELVRDFLRSRPRGWLLAMAKLGEPSVMALRNDHGLFMDWGADKWDALTDDEREALLGQG